VTTQFQYTEAVPVFFGHYWLKEMPIISGKPCDVHLASRIVAVDDEILKILDGRERRVRALRGQHEEMRDSLTVSRGATIRR
jgi:hypothetical protein